MSLVFATCVVLAQALHGSFESGAAASSPRALVAAGVLHFLVALALGSYLRRFGQPRLRLLRTQAGILGAMLLVTLLARALHQGLGLPALWLPVTLAPLWTASSFDRRAGFVVAVAMAFLLAALAGFDGLVLCVLLARGMAATLMYLDRRKSRQLLLSGAAAGATATVVLVAVATLAGAPLSLASDLAAPGRSLVLASLGAGVLEGALATLLRPMAERVLGHVSRERLLQLTDLEQPLLQRLAREAPGTFEHSRAMANLAEQAASAIGADALLTRVGAYYHDLGKTIGAKHFVENLDPGEPSPHDRLAPEESARRILRHVVEGARILREGGIPEPVVEFSYTHHGTQLLEYFLNKRREQAGEGDAIDERLFRYQGMKPQTKETGILMLVDSIEAASRTIDPPDRQRFAQMVQRIVHTKLQQGQLDECNLSLAELRVVQARMVETLTHMHHHRIKYPWQAERAEQFGVPSSAVVGAGRAPTPVPGAAAPLAEGRAPGTPSHPPAPVDAPASVIAIGRGVRS
jgi:putative nucleotidyltransferase with HDIG domain